MEAQEERIHRPVILYDGVCALCNAWVKFVLRWDRKEVFLFAALQSSQGLKLLAERQVNTAALSSIVVVYPEEVFLRSDAALTILTALGWPWSMMAVLRIIPRFLRDALYNFVAVNRYRVFGKYESCPLPDARVRARFIVDK
jgi:predicted DCC family thiol-disulfide oxidoreductase YuxK